MKANRRAARVVGVHYIVAAVASILGGLVLYRPILGPDFLTAGAAHEREVLLGALMELITVCSVIGTAVGLFPYLRRYSESIALGYLCLRFLEGVLITVGVVSVLSVLTLSREFVAAASPNASAFHAVGSALLAAHAWTFMLGPNFMLGLNTALYSYLFYRSGLVPRPIAVLGLISAALIFVCALMELFGLFPQVSLWGGLLAMPVFAYEMTLAVWLILRGFNPSAIATN